MKKEEVHIRLFTLRRFKNTIKLMYDIVDEKKYILKKRIVITFRYSIQKKIVSYVITLIYIFFMFFIIFSYYVLLTYNYLFVVSVLYIIM
jgi:hypothetical protein